MYLEVNPIARLWLNDLAVGQTLERDIFSAAVGGLPLLRRNTVITQSFLDGLRRRGVFAVYVRDATPERRSNFIDPHGFVPRQQPLLTKKLRTTALSALEAIFVEIGRGEEVYGGASRVVEQIDQVVELLVDSLGTDRAALININDLKTHDEYTFHHSLSVAVLAIAIGQHMGLDRAQLNRLGKAGILHDIGKTAIPAELINKPNRLTDPEFTLMKTHSSAGYDFLVKQGIGDEDIQQGVLSHHERVDGSGYPNRLTQDQIPLFALIISVADVYDALTSHRPYRLPMAPGEATEYIMAGVDSSFDFQVVSSFVQKVSLYPVGSYIQLNDGRVCVVMNNENHMRPVVRTLVSGKILDLGRDQQRFNLVITRIVPDLEAKELIGDLISGKAPAR